MTGSGSFRRRGAVELDLVVVLIFGLNLFPFAIRPGVAIGFGIVPTSRLRISGPMPIDIDRIEIGLGIPVIRVQDAGQLAIVERLDIAIVDIARDIGVDVLTGDDGRTPVEQSFGGLRPPAVGDVIDAGGEEGAGIDRAIAARRVLKTFFDRLNAADFNLKKAQEMVMKQNLNEVSIDDLNAYG